MAVGRAFDCARSRGSWDNIRPADKIVEFEGSNTFDSANPRATGLGFELQYTGL